MKKLLCLTFFLIPFLTGSISVFAAETISVLPKVETYEQLVTAIRNVKHASRERLEQFAEQERVREAWETGKLIDEHVLLNKRADYGKRVLKRLAADLGMSHSELKSMLEFARTYPIGVPGGQLSWSHYKALLSINNDTQRQEIAQEAIEKKWSKHELRRQLKKRKVLAEALDSEAILTSVPGKIGLHPIIRARSGEYQGQRVIDLGFSNYYKPDKKLPFSEGEIVAFEKGKFKKVKEKSEALFTYKADVVEVLDGDSFNAVVHLGLGFFTWQTLRLRALDAPEIESAEGREAKEYFEKLIGGKSVIIKTLKSDKYDRYLADVFLDGKYINQSLVEEGLATVVEA